MFFIASEADMGGNNVNTTQQQPKLRGPFAQQSRESPRLSQVPRPESGNPT